MWDRYPVVTGLAVLLWDHLRLVSRFLRDDLWQLRMRQRPKRRTLEILISPIWPKKLPSPR